MLTVKLECSTRILSCFGTWHMYMPICIKLKRFAEYFHFFTSAARRWSCCLLGARKEIAYTSRSRRWSRRVCSTRWKPRNVASSRGYTFRPAAQQWPTSTVTRALAVLQAAVLHVWSRITLFSRHFTMCGSLGIAAAAYQSSLLWHPRTLHLFVYSSSRRPVWMDHTRRIFNWPKSDGKHHASKTSKQ